MLANATDITILAPSNSALESANMDLMSLSGIDGAVQALLSYHVLNGTVSSENITTTPTFARTLLANETYSNVTGGQVVGVRMVEEDGDNMGGVVILSGLGETSMVTVAVRTLMTCHIAFEADKSKRTLLYRTVSYISSTRSSPSPDQSLSPPSPPA